MSTTLSREPDVRVTARWLTGFGTAWLGLWMAQLTPIQLLLPAQVDDVLHHSDSPDGWVGSVVAFGIVSGVAGVCALVAYPLAGAASDRTTSRFGRRRPWIVTGVAIFAVGLAVLGTQHTVVGVGLWWSITLVGFCTATAAITATISDQVPVDQRGLVSGLVSAPQAVGIILGLGLVTALSLSTLVGYLAMAVALVVLVLPFALLVPDAVLPAADRPVLSARAVLTSLWVSPREHPDFGWTLLGRVAVNLGNALGTTLLLYFLEYGLRRPDAQGDLLLLTLVYMVFVIGSSVWLGRVSDRIGRRKPFVVASAAIQGVAALVLALVPVWSAALVAAGLLGLGYGCFLSVDQALATQVLPDPASRGKDLGIMNIATAVPQAMGPLLGAGLVAAFGGFSGLFVAAGVFGGLGAWASSRVRGVP